MAEIVRTGDNPYRFNIKLDDGELWVADGQPRVFTLTDAQREFAEGAVPPANSKPAAVKEGKGA